MMKKHAAILFIEKHILLLSGAWSLWVAYLIVHALLNGGGRNWFGAITQLIGLVVATAVVVHEKRASDESE